MTPQQVGNWRDLLSAKNLPRSLALVGGVTLHALDMFIATTVLPSMVKEIGGLDRYAWNTTLFIVGSILGSALTAKLLASAGSRGAYVVACILFMIGGLLCALAPNMSVVLLGAHSSGPWGRFLICPMLRHGLRRV